MWCVIACVGASKPLSSFLPMHYHSQDGLPLETQVEWMPLNKTEWELLHDTHIARLTSMRPHEVTSQTSACRFTALEKFEEAEAITCDFHLCFDFWLAIIP